MNRLQPAVPGAVPCAVPSAVPSVSPRDAQDGRRVAIAVALAPILLLLALTLVVAGLIGIAAGGAVGLVCSVWLGYELHHYHQTRAVADQAAADGVWR